jgi:hypothetical protein
LFALAHCAAAAGLRVLILSKKTNIFTPAGFLALTPGPAGLPVFASDKGGCPGAAAGYHTPYKLSGEFF